MIGSIIRLIFKLFSGFVSLVVIGIILTLFGDTVSLVLESVVSVGAGILWGILFYVLAASVAPESTKREGEPPAGYIVLSILEGCFGFILFLICATSGTFGWLGILAVSLLVYSGLVALFYGKRISAGQTLKQNRRV
jgi:hypothetical protein